MNWHRYVKETVEQTLAFMTVPIKILKMKKEELKDEKEKKGMQAAIDYLEYFFKKGEDVARLTIEKHLNKINELAGLEEMEHTNDPTNKKLN